MQLFGLDLDYFVQFQNGISVVIVKHTQPQLQQVVVAVVLMMVMMMVMMMVVMMVMMMTTIFIAIMRAYDV